MNQSKTLDEKSKEGFKSSLFKGSQSSTVSHRRNSLALSDYGDANDTAND